MKVIEITNVDFSLRHFLLPLMRGLRERGHEVVGACADGDELIPVRAEGFRVVAVPMARTLSPTGLRPLRETCASRLPPWIGSRWTSHTSSPCRSSKACSERSV